MDTRPGYDPREYVPLTFHDAVDAFRQGRDTPRDYLERCLETIRAREPEVKGWVTMRIDGARADADASARRYRAGAPLSPIDGMPIAVKDNIETRDMPTTLGLRDYRLDSGRDSPSIRALREAGAIVLGKAVTTELSGGTLSVTTNPFDPACTAGGSSSGSAAVVGARMVPAAIGTQVSGSLIRPASYCANVAMRPSMGGILRGERSNYSHGVIGVHAGSLADMWQVTIQIVKRAGGDPGYPGVVGREELAPPVMPRTVGMIETEGWPTIDDATRGAVEQVLERLERLGVRIVRRRDDAFVEALEQSLASAARINSDILAWENRWIYEHLFETIPEKLSEWTMRIIERGRGLKLDDYRLALARRDDARNCQRRLAGRLDALIALSSPGSAPPLAKPPDPDPRIAYGTTGSSVFNVGTSLLGAPAVTMPLMGIGRMPVGMQLIGQPGEDERVTGHARWVMDSIEPVVA